MKFQTKTRSPFARALVCAALFAVTLSAFLLDGERIVYSQKTSRAATVPKADKVGKVDAPNGSLNETARKHPFEPNEELVYVGEFSRALLKKIDVADFRLTAVREPALPKTGDNGSPQRGGAAYSLKFTGEITSKGFFAKLFNLRFREWIQSTVDPNSFTVTKTSKIDEQGKRKRTSETTYRDGKVLWIEKDPTSPSRPPRSVEAAFVGQVQDILSAIYFLRTRELGVGKTFELTISDSGNVYQVPVHVVEKKRMKTVLGRVEAVRVDPQVFGPNGMIAEEGSFSIWLTNDKRHIPVSARIKADVGTFDITLRKVTQKSLAPESLASSENAN